MEKSRPHGNTHQLTIRIAKNILQGHFRWDLLSKTFIQYPVKTSFQPVMNLRRRAKVEWMSNLIRRTCLF